MLFIFLTYRRSFSLVSQVHKFKPFADAGLGPLSCVCAHLEAIASWPEFDVRCLLKGITGRHSCELLQTSVPFFTLLGLVHYFSFEPKVPSVLFSIFPFILSEYGDIDTTLVTLHLIRFFVAAFPRVGGDWATDLSDATSGLLKFLGDRSPVSDIAVELGESVAMEMKVPGWGFLGMMRAAWEGTIATNGQVPIFYDPEWRFFPNLMHNRRSSRSSLDF